MTAKLYVTGLIGEDTTLLDVIRQFKSFDNPTSIEVNIESGGGYVSEGMSIFSFLRNQGLPVTTIAKRAYSIAASIFMAGDERIVEEGDALIMVHMPWAMISGDSEELREASEVLAKMEEDFIGFYMNYLNLDGDTIRTLLKNETYLSSEQALELGFATQVKQSQVMAMAYYNKEDIVEVNNTDTNTQKMTKVEKFYNALRTFFKEEALSLVVQDGVGNEINFTELSVGERPAEGDKAVVDNKPASGEHIMSDGSVYVFSDGKLSTIREAVEARAEAPEESSQEVEVSEEAPAQEEASEEVAETEEVVEETQEEVNEEVPAQEESTEEPEAEAEEVQEEAGPNVEQLISDLESRIYETLDARYKEENDALRQEIATLKKNIGSEVDVQPSNDQRNNKRQGGSFLTDALRGR